jgi:hypothetical protein
MNVPLLYSIYVLKKVQPGRPVQRRCRMTLWGRNQNGNAKQNTLNIVFLSYHFLPFIANESKRQCKNNTTTIFSIGLYPLLGTNQSAYTKYIAPNVVFYLFFPPLIGMESKRNMLTIISLTFLFLPFIGMESKRECQIDYA